MANRCLIIGLGIGNLYKSILTDHDVYTVDLDPSKGADFTSVDQAIAQIGMFDLTVVCTPNHTHYQVADSIADNTRLLLIEKPGVMHPDLWLRLVMDHPKTRIMMVKNNQWRDNIQELKSQAMSSRLIELKWHNRSRIPSPGSWFTDKDRALGGVSADLMPHLLSFVASFEDRGYPWHEPAAQIVLETRHKLKDITHTDYGIIDYSGIYNVDDYAELVLDYGPRRYVLTADWANGQEDDRCIYFQDSKYEFGLCPESAYRSMIEEAMFNLDTLTYWNHQLALDLWIQSRIR